MDIYVDSSAFVNSIREDEKGNNDSKKFFEFVFSNAHKFNVYTSYFTMLEVACAFKRREPKRASALFNKWIQRMATQVKFLYPEKKREILLADLMANFIPTIRKYSRKTMDTIHIHTVLNHKIKVVVATDNHFKEVEKKIKVEVLTPKEFSEKYKDLENLNRKKVVVKVEALSLKTKINDPKIK